MENAENCAQFCPGCPNTGNFVGDITESSIYIINKQILRNGLETEFVGAVRFVDNYEMSSKTVFTTVFEYDETEKKVENLKNGANQSILDRIRKCVGFTATFDRGANAQYSVEIRSCPALNTNVLDRLSEEG